MPDQNLVHSRRAEHLLRIAFEPVSAALSDGRIPGAALGVALANGETATTFGGFAARVPKVEPLEIDSIFDLASLTKVIFTTRAILALADRRRLHLDQPLRELLPGIPQGADHGSLTIRQCLGHQTWLPWHEPLFKLGLDREGLRRYMLERDWPKGSPAYSDINFVLLGMVIEAVTDAPLTAWPLEDGFTATPLPDRTAATELCPWRGRVLRGEVHDENAFALGGLAGHAGLFGTLAAVLAYGARILSGEALSPAGMAAIRTPVSTTRTLGFERRHADWSGGERASSEAIGHTGFTGTGLWIDFANGVAWMLLTNRVHPSRDRDTGIIPLRREVGNRIITALAP